MPERVLPASMKSRARIAGVFYLLTFVTGILAALPTAAKFAANLIATVCYVAVTVLFYGLFRPVNPGVSLVAALVSLAGCVVGTLNLLKLISFPVSNLVFFGGYCLLIGWLIFRSTFMPRVLGVLMAIGG